jgi:nicotinate-nucleotide pyrophosphorylase (carboxylating)
VQGPAAAILTGERTALNFLGLLSGVASAAQKYAEHVKGTVTNIYDTRKTPPGLRALVKYAVAAGGGVNHRLGLFDGILIKDNHIRLAGSVTEAVYRVRRRYGRKYPVEVEVENLAELKEALAVGVEILLLDNLRGPKLKQAVGLAKAHAELEISGGMDEAAAAAAAKLGVDRISVGALTHSAPWLAMHMEME